MAKGRERSVKFYFQNEAEVMRELGLEPTKGSGSSWVEKEDGQNDHIIAQLKSTDKQSYKLNKLDLEKLEYNASVARKIPMFIVQFLSDDSRYALVNIDDIPDIAKYIEFGEVEKPDDNFINMVDDHSDLETIAPVEKKKTKQKVKSSASARKKFFKEKEAAWEKKKWK